MKFLKKYHKWLGIILTLLIILFSLSGIVLNHRALFFGIDVNRDYLPDDYQYHHWNNAAVKGTEKLNNDSILMYGNIGIWLTDSTFSKFSNFDKGFPKGMDNRKVCKVYRSSKGELFAGSLFGLYQYNYTSGQWQNRPLPIEEKRIVDITEKQDTLIVLSRSFLLKTTGYSTFSVHTLPEPVDYDNKIGLFKTLWVIHSGEIFGTLGILLVDLLAVIFIFLSITGLIFFINPYIIKKRLKKNKDVSRLKRSSKWNLKWHNKIGWTTTVLLIIVTLTGMFLRPPLLIAIANARVGKIPFSELDAPNPWFDKLRRIIYDAEEHRYIVATNEGIYYSDDNFSSKLKSFDQEPPISVMGANVFEKTAKNTYLVGSFEGLFLWQSNTGQIDDYIEKKPYKKPIKRGPPIGNNVVAGYTKHFARGDVFFDYGKGAQLIDKTHNFVPMPAQIQKLGMSLWNVALEVHTARIYRSLIGMFYILIIPLFGLLTLFILISGFIVWYKRHRKVNRKRE